MSKISIGDVLAAGFRLIRRNPLAPLAWGGVYLLLFSLPVTAITFATMGKMTGLSLNPGVGGVAVLELFVGEAAFGLLTFSLINAAIFRAVLKPEKGARFYLRLSGDEGRQALVIAAFGAVMILVGFGVGLVVGILAAILGVAARAGAPGGSYAMIALVYLVMAPVLAFVGVRFALSGPATFSKKHFAFSDSWALTRGNVWRLIGVAAVLTVIALVYAVVFAGLGLALGKSGQTVTALSGGGGAALGSPKQLAVTAILLLLGGAASGYLMPILTAPWAEAYRQLSGDGLAEVFSDYPGPWGG